METRAVKEALKSPDLQDLPVFTPGGAVSIAARIAKPGAGPSAPALPAPPPSLSASTREALEAAIAKPPFGSLSVVPFPHPDGTTRLLLQVYVEGPAPAPPVRAAWLVRAKDGREVLRAEQTVEPKSALKGVFADLAIPVPVAPGDYDLAFVLVDGGGVVVHSARKSTSITQPPTSELSASGLFLAVTDLPADGAKVDSPFVSGGRKFVGRGDGLVSAVDGLSYFMRLRGPGIDPATRKAVTEGAKGEPPVVDVAGIVADANIGDYFVPGDYVITVSVTDAVRNAKIEVSEPFTIVGKK
jgi:hypothetical protein